MRWGGAGGVCFFQVEGGVRGVVRGPVVSGALLMRGATTLAGDLPLFFRGHRGEAAAFLTLSVDHRTVLCKISHHGRSPPFGPVGQPARYMVWGPVPPADPARAQAVAQWAESRARPVALPKARTLALSTPSLQVYRQAVGSNPVPARRGARLCRCDPSDG